jgi:hypothetical protein
MGEEGTFWPLASVWVMWKEITRGTFGVVAAESSAVLGHGAVSLGEWFLGSFEG